VRLSLRACPSDTPSLGQRGDHTSGSCQTVSQVGPGRDGARNVVVLPDNARRPPAEHFLRLGPEVVHCRRTKARKHSIQERGWLGETLLSFRACARLTAKEGSWIRPRAIESSAGTGVGSWTGLRPTESAHAPCSRRPDRCFVVLNTRPPVCETQPALCRMLVTVNLIASRRRGKGQGSPLPAQLSRRERSRKARMASTALGAGRSVV
jgi:hypothetical protein